MPKAPRCRHLLRRRAALLAVPVLALFGLAPPATAGSIVWAKNPGSSSQATIEPQIWIADEDGSNARLLYKPPRYLPGMRSPDSIQYVHDPFLSADGKTLVFSAQINARYFSGLANTCGMFCEGIYRVQGGFVARISSEPSRAVNGCDGSSLTDLCQSFESGAVVADGAILFEDRQDYWVNCGSGGCSPAPDAIYHLFRAYVPQPGGTFGLGDIFSWSSDCASPNREPAGTSFDSNGTDIVMVGCATPQGTTIRMTDANSNFRDVALLYGGGPDLSLSPDGTRVIMTGAKPGSTDTEYVWSFEPKASGLPDNYWVVIARDQDDVNVAKDVTIGATYLYSAARDGDLHRWPLGCGPEFMCRFGFEDVKITDDSGAVYDGSRWADGLVDNEDPRWTAATTANLGGPTTRPSVSGLGVRCANATGRCRLRLSWNASRAGSLRLTVKPTGKPAFTVTVAARAGRGARTLAARALPRRKRITVTARLTSGGVASAPATIRTLLR